jgi:ribonuclease HI
MKVTIYTDGSSRGNPGPGGWGAIVLTESEVLELGGGEANTTNNRMELMGTIRGLQVVGSNADSLAAASELVTSVEVCTDSEYVKKGMTEWIDGWIAKGWKTASKKPVLNQDLWEQLKFEGERLEHLGITTTWTYVPGHAGVALNERADEIATGCADAIIENSGNNVTLYRGNKKDYFIQL